MIFNNNVTYGKVSLAEIKEKNYGCFLNVGYFI